MNTLLAELAKHVVFGDMDAAVQLTQKAMEEGLDPQSILQEGLIGGMDEVSTGFKAGEMFVPEVLRSARAMQHALNQLRPILAESGIEAVGRVLIGTVKGDLHDIGKNLVGMMCEGAGFEVMDLGRDVDPEVFVDAVREFKPQVVGLSALLTTTMRMMEYTIQALEGAGLRDQVKVMVGGAPITQTFADQIGADGYASNAASATELARSLIKD
jgi:5-methyltetrahydrofolate--homocysteine methyltransferase